MDFSSVEIALYGDVEKDEDLLAELMKLEAEEKSQNACSNLSSDKNRSISHDVPKRGNFDQRAINLAEMNSSLIHEALTDIDDSMDDEEEITDPDLLAELSHIVEEELSESKTKENCCESTVNPSETPVDSVLLERLQKLNVDYTKMCEMLQNEKDSAKFRRCKRAITKLNELMKNVSAGKKIDENDIPAPLYLSSSIVKNSELNASSACCAQNDVSSTTSLPIPKDTSLPISKDTSLPIPKESYPPPIPPRKSSTAFEQNIPLSTIEKASIDNDAIIAETVNSSNNVVELDSLKLLENPNGSNSNVSSSSPISDINQMKALLQRRKDAYVNNARLANAGGDKKVAYEYYSIAKLFDKAIEAVNNGEVSECSENDLPPYPTPYKKKENTVSSPSPKTLLDGLVQRLERYTVLCEKAKADNDARKYRMNLRIIKQYEEAIRACRMGKAIDTSGLPCPPGFPSLPNTSKDNSLIQTSEFAPSASQFNSRVNHEIGPFAATVPLNSRDGCKSRQSNQLEFLQKRQLLFKQAALFAKQKGDIIAAKKYLLASKGFDPMIKASKAGLPVNISKAPIPPQMQAISKNLKPALSPQESLDSSAVIQGNRGDIFAVMELDLIRQVRLCEENRLAFAKLGDVPRVKLFESWLTNTKRDLIQLRQLAKSGASLPKFRYEVRNFPSLDVCTEVNENQLELTIICVLDSKLPAGWQPCDGNIFVKYDFSFPHDNHQVGKTKVVYGSNSPEFNEKFLLNANRKSRQLLRVIKRNCLKFEVYQKGGFLRSDKLLGTSDCKLVVLEEKTEIHESVSLMDGRKPAGGKIEYKVRIREPFGENKLNVSQGKWLVLEI